MRESQLIESTFDRLWPICRSILGPGYRASLDILAEVFPHERLTFATGTRILDWTVPQEWVPESAFLQTPDGRRVADFKTNNLHLLNYSQPFEGRLSKQELREHVYTLPAQPDAIPYVTSYYAPRWGFCLSQQEWDALPEGEYLASIQTRLVDGHLVVAEAVLPGASEKEILFSSYLCHPSMANNELSGPLMLSFLYRRLAQKKNRKYTYRFAILPETIGSVALLSQRGAHFQKHLVAGYVLTCIGDGGKISYKASRQQNSLADRAARAALRSYDGARFYDFNPAVGSDERQFCSPGFNLPVGSFLRTLYTEYPEYHTSLDNKALMDFEKMSETLDYLEKTIAAVESNETWENLFPHGEPQLGPRGVFRTLSDKHRHADEIALWWVLNYSDRQNDTLAIAERAGLPFDTVARVAEQLHAHGLLQRVAP